MWLNDTTTARRQSNPVLNPRNNNKHMHAHMSRNQGQRQVEAPCLCAAVVGGGEKIAEK